MAKAPLPSELMRTPVDVRKRMDWVLENSARVPLLVTLVTASNSELHVVAIIRRGGNLLVVDTEESYSLKLCKAALSFCCGSGEKIKGIGSVMRVGPRYEMEGPKKNAAVSSSSPAETGYGSRASDEASSSKKATNKPLSHGGASKDASPRSPERSSASPNKHQKDIDTLLSFLPSCGSSAKSEHQRSSERGPPSPCKDQITVQQLLSTHNRRASASPEKKKQKGLTSSGFSRPPRPTCSSSGKGSTPKPRNWGFNKPSSSKKN